MPAAQVGEIKHLLRADYANWKAPLKWIDAQPSVRTDFDFFFRMREGLEDLVSGQRQLLDHGYAPLLNNASVARGGMTMVWREVGEGREMGRERDVDVNTGFLKKMSLCADTCRA